MAEHTKDTEKRIAQKFLANVVTQMVHGSEALDAIQQSEAFFSKELDAMGSWTKEKFEDHFKKTEKIKMNVLGN